MRSQLQTGSRTVFQQICDANLLQAARNNFSWHHLHNWLLNTTMVLLKRVFNNLTLIKEPFRADILMVNEMRMRH